MISFWNNLCVCCLKALILHLEALALHHSKALNWFFPIKIWLASRAIFDILLFDGYYPISKKKSLFKDCFKLSKYKSRHFQLHNVRKSLQYKHSSLWSCGFELLTFFHVVFRANWIQVKYVVLKLCCLFDDVIVNLAQAFSSVYLMTMYAVAGSSRESSRY